MAGKGSKNRTSDYKKYYNHYDEIFKKKNKEQETVKTKEVTNVSKN